MTESLPPNSIFMCYRRADSEEMVDRIYDTLAGMFGEAAIFRDIDTIPVGVDFPTYIQDSLRGCSVTLVFIGREWASCTDAGGRRRIDDPCDHVRIEVETALALPESRVIPVFVRRADTPSVEELPESLRSLRRRNGITVRSSGLDYKSDITQLGKILEDAVKHVLAARQAAAEERGRQQLEQEAKEQRERELAGQRRLEEAAAEEQRRQEKEARKRKLAEHRRLEKETAQAHTAAARQLPAGKEPEIPKIPSTESSPKVPPGEVALAPIPDPLPRDDEGKATVEVKPAFSSSMPQTAPAMPPQANSPSGGEPAVPLTPTKDAPVTEPVRRMKRVLACAIAGLALVAVIAVIAISFGSRPTHERPQQRGQDTWRSPSGGADSGHTTALSVKSAPEAHSFSLISSDNVVIRTGETPANLRDIPPGKYQVRFTFKNRSSYFVRTTVGSEADAGVEVDFQSIYKIPSLIEDLNRMDGIINLGARVAQEVGPPILRVLGYFAAKGNGKLKAVMEKHKYEAWIPDANQLKEMDKEIAKTNTLSSLYRASASGPAPASPAFQYSPIPDDGLAVEYTPQVLDGINKNAATIEKAIAERKPLVAQSEELQKKFIDLMKEVNELAKLGDEDAKKIIINWGIKVKDP